jgi:hypothetical protein
VDSQAGCVVQGQDDAPVLSTDTVDRLDGVHTLSLRSMRCLRGMLVAPPQPGGFPRLQSLRLRLVGDGACAMRLHARLGVLMHHLGLGRPCGLAYYTATAAAEVTPCTHTRLSAGSCCNRGSRRLPGHRHLSLPHAPQTVSFRLCHRSATANGWGSVCMQQAG